MSHPQATNSTKPKRSKKDPQQQRATAVVSLSSLQEMASRCLRFVPSRPSYAILGSIRIRTDGDSLYLSACDGASAVEAKIDMIDGQMLFDLCAPPKLLTDLVNRLSGETVSITAPCWASETYKAVLASEASEYEVGGCLPNHDDDFGSLSIDHGLLFTSAFEIDRGSDLAALLRSVSYAMADESNPVGNPTLAGIHFTVTHTETALISVKVAALDSHRLAWAEQRFGEDGEDGEDEPTTTSTAFVLPDKFCTELERVLRSVNDPITIGWNDDKTVFRFAWHGLRFSTLKLDGGHHKFPDYSGVVPGPERLTRTATIDRIQLLQALDRISLLSNKTIHGVLLEFDPSGCSLVLSADVADVGCGQESIDSVQLSFPEDDELFRIVFKSEYLTQALKSLDAPTIRLAMGNPLEPSLILLADADDQCHLVMPIQRRAASTES